MSQRYTIIVTDEQLAALRHALICAEREYEALLPQREQGLRYWESYPDDHSEKAKFLAMSKENLEYVRRHLAMMKAASPALYEGAIQDREVGS